jgi:hypothetical protein
VTTFPQPKGLCIHGKRLKFDPCRDCTHEIATAEIDANLSTVEGPHRSDGGLFADPAYHGEG